MLVMLVDRPSQCPAGKILVKPYSSCSSTKKKLDIFKLTFANFNYFILYLYKNHEVLVSAC